jgi:hypothetical protein
MYCTGVTSLFSSYVDSKCGFAELRPVPPRFCFLPDVRTWYDPEFQAGHKT